MKPEAAEHPISPVFNEESKVLILGSFPSKKSREQRFFYGHPRNRFWQVVSAIGERELPNTVEEKKELLLSLKIAVWDVIKSCEIVGSSDNTIKNVVPNDLSLILSKAKIEQIFVNGKTAKKYYDKYISQVVGREAYCLPSTSPANATWRIERLIEGWQPLKECLSK